MVYAMNQNGWLALIICGEKKSEKLQFAVAKEFTR